MSRIKRIKQVFCYGWKHASQISQDSFNGEKRFSLFLDILTCFYKYGMWSNQYLKERFWTLEEGQRLQIGSRCREENYKKEMWLKDFYANSDFLMKYSAFKYEKEPLREKRKKAYSKRYNAGKNLAVEYDVNISRQHYLDGTISIGDNVLLAKHVSIDYSGQVVLEDDVKLSQGVVIESHGHEFIPGSDEYKAIPTSILIEKGAWIGQDALICESTKRIGRYAQIGAGAVVRTSIPPYAVVIGNPSKIIGYVLTPEEVESFEAQNTIDSPLSIEQYRLDYEKSFINRLEEIKRYTKIK